MRTGAVLNGVTQAISRMTRQLGADNLRARCMRGGMTLGVGVTLGRGLQLVRYIILTRLLVPDELGLMAIILAASLLFETVFEVGVKQSVIQNKRGAEPEYLNASWWFQTVRGLSLFVAAFLAAPAVSRFYDKPELLLLLRVTLLAFIFKGLISPGAHVLEKKFRFYKAVLLSQASSLLGTLLTISLAFLLRNIWALVIGYVCESFLFCLLSYVLCPFRPRFGIDRDCLSEIIRFARGMFGLSVLAMVAFEIDVIVLGKLVPMGVIGIYSMARRLARAPKELYMRIFGPVLLSAFSEKQDDRAYLCRAVLKVTKATAMFGAPLTGFFVVCAGSVLSIVFGRQYTAAAVPFGLLSICTLVRTEGISLASIYLAVGKPHLHRGFVGLRAVILLCLIYPSIIFFGLVGAAAAVLLAELVGLFVQVFWMQKRIGLRFSEYIYCWTGGLALAQIVVVPVTALKFFGPPSAAVSLVTGAGLCLLAGVIGLVLLRGLTTNGEPAKIRPKGKGVETGFEAKIKYA